jgi:hypothetical protein
MASRLDSSAGATTPTVRSHSTPPMSWYARRPLSMGRNRSVTMLRAGGGRRGRSWRRRVRASAAAQQRHAARHGAGARGGGGARAPIFLLLRNHFANLLQQRLLLGAQLLELLHRGLDLARFFAAASAGSHASRAAGGAAAIGGAVAAPQGAKEARGGDK